MALYHYTTETRYNSIISSGTLNASNNIKVDAAYGPGWYFTDLPPETCEKILMEYCWTRPTLHQRVKYYLQIEVRGGIASWQREHVYLVPQSPYVSFAVLDHGPTPECSKKPCYSCADNPVR